MLLGRHSNNVEVYNREYSLCFHLPETTPAHPGLYSSGDIHIFLYIRMYGEASLVVQWLGIRLPMQGTQV